MSGRAGYSPAIDIPPGDFLQAPVGLLDNTPVVWDDDTGQLGDGSAVIETKAGAVNGFLPLSRPTHHAPGLGLFFPEAEGALGDGSHDDTAAIVATMVAASAAKGRVWLGPYDYLYSSIDETLSDLIIQGTIGTRLLSSLPVSTSLPGMWLHGSNIVIEQVSFDYVTPLNIDTDGATIYANGGNASTIRIGYAGITSFVDNITISRCSVKNSRNTAYFVEGASRVHIIDNYAQEIGQGVCCADISGDCHVRGNTIHRSLDDMYAFLADATLPASQSLRLTIANNIGYQGYGQGIDCTGVDGVTITGNVIDQTWSTGIMIYQYTGIGPTGPCSNVTVTGNTVKNSGQYYGVGQYRTAPGATQGYGCQVSDSVNVTVIGNRFQNPTLGGFHNGGNNTGLRIHKNPGYNPVGPVGPPAVFPADGVPLVNPFGMDAQVFLYGSITQVDIGGAVAGYSTSFPFTVPAGQSITVHYTGSPGWNWTLD